MSHHSLVSQYQAFVSCAPLWSAPGAPFSLFSFPWQECVSAVENIEVPENVVFGRKMESFFSHAITHSQRYAVLAENLQVISGKTTLGEIDFLIRDNLEGQIIHVELACKFYLYDTSREYINPYSAWVGPNQNDFLDRKIEKLKNKQLPLLQHPECQKMLTPIIGSGTSNIFQQVHFPAYLFLPLGAKEAPTNINREAVKGFWLRPEQLSDSIFDKALFCLPSKSDWLLPPHKNSDWVSVDIGLKQIGELHKNKKSPMVWVKYPDGKHLRLFVVWW